MILLNVIQPKNDTCHTEIIWFFFHNFGQSRPMVELLISFGKRLSKVVVSWKRQCINFDILWIRDIFTKIYWKVENFGHTAREIYCLYVIYDLLGKTIDIFLEIEQFCFKICPMGNGCCARGVIKLRKLLEADHR
jgi:hypothetical protein